MRIKTRKFREGTKHPAKFSDSILVELNKLMDEFEVTGTVLDPFAGTGKVLELARGREETTRFILVELEEEWAEEARQRRNFLKVPGVVHVGDFLELGAQWIMLPETKWNPKVSACVTSPVYGNRMSDTFTPTGICSKCKGTGEATGTDHTDNEPKECGPCQGTGRRSHTYNTYTAKLGRKLSDNNSGGMQFHSIEYQTFHLEAYRTIYKLLTPGGLFFLNVSDFIQDFRPVHACAWHAMAARGAGFEMVRMVNVDTPRLGYGENYDARVAGERVYVFSKPAGGAK